MASPIPVTNLVLLGALIVFFQLLVFIMSQRGPTIRPVQLSDPNLQFPFLDHDRVPNSALFIGSFGIPPLVYLAVEKFAAVKGPGIVAVTLATVETNFITLVITELAKNMVGRPRPYFATVCTSYVPGSDHVCVTQDSDAATINEARVSFPSGHSSLSFAAMILLTFVLVSMWRTSPKFQKNTLVTYITMLPLILACYVAISRVMDYRHHYGDIVGGACLGALVSSVVYNVHFADPVPTPDPVRASGLPTYGST